MTREEARSILRNAAWLGTNEGREKIESAVKFLCGESCDDAVSRQAVLSLPRKTLRNYFGEKTAEVIDVKDIVELPSVTPQEPRKSRDMKEIEEVINCDADAETKCKMISNILTAKPHYFEEPQESEE